MKHGPLINRFYEMGVGEYLMKGERKDEANQLDETTDPESDTPTEDPVDTSADFLGSAKLR